MRLAVIFWGLNSSPLIAVLERRWRHSGECRQAMNRALLGRIKPREQDAHAEKMCVYRPKALQVELPQLGSAHF